MAGLEKKTYHNFSSPSLLNEMPVRQVVSQVQITVQVVGTIFSLLLLRRRRGRRRRRRRRDNRRLFLTASKTLCQGSYSCLGYGEFLVAACTFAL